MSGRVDVQSRARRSYKAVVMPTDALLTFGMLKLTSLMMESCRGSRWDKELSSWMAQLEINVEKSDVRKQADVACSSDRTQRNSVVDVKGEMRLVLIADVAGPRGSRYGHTRAAE